MARPLPTFPARHDREQVALEASRAVVGLFVREGSSDFSVKQLADHAGLSERTFYRYFPRKEHAIRPYVEAGLAHIVAAVREGPRDRPLGDVLVDAHAGILDLAVDGGDAFLAVVNADPSLRAVWLQVVTDAEIAFAEVVADRLGIPPDSVRARAAGAAIVTAGRLALHSAGTRPPRDVFVECLDLLDPALLR